MKYLAERIKSERKNIKIKNIIGSLFLIGYVSVQLYDSNIGPYLDRKREEVEYLQELNKINKIAEIDSTDATYLDEVIVYISGDDTEIADDTSKVYQMWRKHFEVLNNGDTTVFHDE